MANYYVDATLGDDGGTGAIGDPWETISKINSTSFSAGDTVNFKRGETWSGTELICDNSGTSGNYITYQDYGSGDKPIIKNPGSSFERCIRITTGDYVELKNLIITDTHAAGVHINNGASYAIVEYCEIYAVGVGIKVYGDNGIYRYNYIHDLTMEVNDVGGDNDYGAVGIWFFDDSSNSEACYNTLENCRAPSYDYGYDGGAFEFATSGTISNVKIHHNWSTGCEGFCETGGSGGTGLLQDIEIYHNIGCENYGAASLSFHTTGGFLVGHDNFQVYNNTFVDTRDYASPKYSFISIGTGAGAGDLIFKNNIFYVLDWWYICDSADKGWTWTHEYNCHYIPNSTSGFTLSTGEINQDPEFVNVSTEDFNLQSSSPCVDTGTDVSLTEDYDGKAIPYNIIPDIGAYEYTETALEINVELKRA